MHQNSWHQVWQELSLLFKFTLHDADVRVTILVPRNTEWGTLNTHRSKQKLVTQYVERSGPWHSSFETGQVSLIIKKPYLLLYLYGLTDSQYTKSIQKCTRGCSKCGLGLRKGVLERRQLFCPKDPQSSSLIFHSFHLLQFHTHTPLTSNSLQGREKTWLKTSLHVYFPRWQAVSQQHGFSPQIWPPPLLPAQDQSTPCEARIAGLMCDTAKHAPSLSPIRKQTKIMSSSSEGKFIFSENLCCQCSIQIHVRACVIRGVSTAVFSTANSTWAWVQLKPAMRFLLRRRWYKQGRPTSETTSAIPAKTYLQM